MTQFNSSINNPFLLKDVKLGLDTGYRIFSDGYVEQYGAVIGNTQFSTVNLFIPVFYSDINTQPISTGGFNDGGGYMLWLSNITRNEQGQTTNLQFRRSTPGMVGGSTDFVWNVKGYINV